MRVAALVILLSSLASVLPATAQAEEPDPWTATDLDFESWDGTILKARLYEPKDAAGPAPAVIVTNGWNNRHDAGSELRFSERFARQGYVVFAFTSRGWGNSGGDIELDGPSEVKDVQAVVDHLATLDSVLQDGDNDPRVGMVGESYAGGIQHLAARQEPRIDSLIPLITWSNLLESLAPADVPKVGWINLFFASGHTVGRGIPLSGNAGDPNPSGPSNQLNEWYAEMTANNGPTEEMRTDIGVVRSLTPDAILPPTLLFQGWGDTLFTPNAALATFNHIEAQPLRADGTPTPHRLVLFPGGHGIKFPSDEAPSLAADALMDEWFNVTLRGQEPTSPPYPILRYRYAEADYVGELQWPPAGITTWRGYLGPSEGADGLVPSPVDATPVNLVNPVAPVVCNDVPNYQSTASFCPNRAPETYAVWGTPAFAQAAEMTGSPSARLVVQSTQATDVRLFVSLVDMAPDGSLTSIQRQTVPVRLAGAAQPTPVNITLEATTWDVAAGHAVGLQVATTDLAYFASREGGQITISSTVDEPSWVDLPIVPKDAWGDRAAPNVTGGLEWHDCPAGCFVLFNAQVVDDLALANVTVLHEDGREAQPTISKNRANQWQVTADGFGANETATLRAVDLAGNEVVVESTPGPHPGCSICSDEPVDDSSEGAPAVPLGILAAAMLAAVLVRRRS